MARPKSVHSHPLDSPEYTDTLSRLRQMWELTLLFQFTMFFRNSLLKFSPTDHFDIDILEEELFGFASEFGTLAKIKTGLVKLLLDSKARTGEFDPDVAKIYASRLAASRGSDVENPLEDVGDGKWQCDWEAMGIEDRVRVLAQMCRWVSTDGKFSDRFEMVLRQDQIEPEEYRILPIGTSEKKNEFVSYFLMDDNRLYKKTDFGPEIEDSRRPKKKRKRTVDAQQQQQPLSEALAQERYPDWQCVASSLDQFQKLAKNNAVKENLSAVMGAIEQYYEHDRVANAVARVKQRDKMEAVAHRKRSSRLETKRVQQYEEEEQTKEQEALDLENMSKRQINAMLKSRTLRYRERIKKQKDKVAKSESNDNATRRSTRTRDRSDKEDERHWTFDCRCGVWGDDHEDDKPAVQCEQCNTWMHQDCLEVNDEDAQREDWVFICDMCIAEADRLERERIRLEEKEKELERLRIEDEEKKKRQEQMRRQRNEQKKKERALKKQQELEQPSMVQPSNPMIHPSNPMVQPSNPVVQQPSIAQQPVASSQPASNVNHQAHTPSLPPPLAAPLLHANNQRHVPLPGPDQILSSIPAMPQPNGPPPQSNGFHGSQKPQSSPNGAPLLPPVQDPSASSVPPSFPNLQQPVNTQPRDEQQARQQQSIAPHVPALNGNGALPSINLLEQGSRQGPDSK